MKHNKCAWLLLCTFLTLPVLGQQPKYTYKYFAGEEDTAKFQRLAPKESGLHRTYLIFSPEIWDLDDNQTTFIRGGGARKLVFFEGQKKNGKRNGVYVVYLVGSTDHSRKYKIWEQEYKDDKLNGQWRIYTLKGTLVGFKTFKEDKQVGLSRNFRVDGKTVKDESEHFEDGSVLFREFYSNGKVKSEIPDKDGKLSGKGKKYYENGTLQEEAEFEDGEFHGTRKYYYPNGQLWIEQVYKNGKSWKVIANYTDKGKKRDGGTLKNGNGTIIFYNDDNTVREVITYVNGEEKQRLQRLNSKYQIE